MSKHWIPDDHLEGHTVCHGNGRCGINDRTVGIPLEFVETVTGFVFVRSCN